MINFLQPKWKHTNKSVRLAAINELDPRKDMESLVEIVNSNDDVEILTMAINKLHDRNALESILQSKPCRELLILIENKLDKIYFDQVMASDNGSDINDELTKISSEKILAEIVNKIASIDLKKQAIGKISDNSILSRITESKCGKVIGCIAVDRVNDEDCLIRIGSHASNKHVRSYALKKIDEIASKEQELSESEKRELKFKEMSDLANCLAVSWNWEYAAKTFRQSKMEWESLDPNNDHYLTSNFDQLYTRFFERYAQFKTEQKEIEKKQKEREKVIDYHKEICNGIESLHFTIDGGSDRQFSEYKSRWTLTATDDDFKTLLDRFESVCLVYEDSKRQTLEDTEKTRQLRTELSRMCNQAELIVDFVDLSGSENQLKQLRNEWTNLQSGHSKIDDLDVRFSLALDTFEKKKESYLAQLDQDQKDFVQKLNDLCTSVEQSFTASASELMNSEKRVKEAQKVWSKIEWPEKELDKEFSTLKKRFKNGCDLFYEKLRDCREKDGWERWSNLTVKEELCKAIETLETKQDTYKVTREIREYHKQWKNIGKVPFEKADSINNRFKTCSDRIYKRCDLFFKRIEEERGNHLQLKSKIISEVAALVNSAATRREAGKVKKLQKKWWEIGSVPKDKKVELEQVFKSSCDAFFAKHRTYLDQLTEQYNANAVKREELCVRAESLQLIDDWGIALGNVKLLQGEWKEIGPTSENQNKVLWPRFNNAINLFFNLADKNRPKNLAEKKQLIDQLSNVLQEVKADADLNEKTIQKLANDVRSIQKKWRSVGPVPKDEDKHIYDSFQNSCDSFFETRRTILKKSEDHQKKLLVKKRKMLANLKEVSDSGDWANSSIKIDEIMKIWTDIGELSLIDSKDIDKQFKRAYNLFYERKRIQLGEIDKKCLVNLKSKEELCYRMELLADREHKTGTKNDDTTIPLSKQLEIAFESNFISAAKPSDTGGQSWQNSLSEVKKIQNEWKKIGPCPTESEYVLSQRLKKAEDGFFSKRPNAKPVDDPVTLKSNLREKISICEKIERLSKEEDLPSIINIVKKWQKKWKDIGPVHSKKDSEILWQRYNTACDIIYEAVRGAQEKSY